MKLKEKFNHNDDYWFNQLTNSPIYSNEGLKRQYISLYKRNKELVNSLNYAKIIQKGVLPKDRHFNRFFSDAFVYYQPQSYISGDFYWVGEHKNLKIFAVGDCTGHGVPGALLTMLAQSFLNYIVLGKKIIHPTSILKEFDKKFIETFMGDNEDIFHNDWIDIALCCYDESEKKIYFSGAKRKLLHVSKYNAIIYNGNNYPIGGWQLELNRSFNHHEFNVSEGDMIYIGSDGFQDQIGGEKNKKFGSKQLHELLSSIIEMPCELQLKQLKTTFNKWKTTTEQLDDICLMGIRI